MNEKKEISFRLLSELYSLLCWVDFIFRGYKGKFPSPLGVIFSLILDNIIIHSFYNIYNSFRLLSELYSLLFDKTVSINMNMSSFRLLSELYSLLFEMNGFDKSVLEVMVSVSSRSYILSYHNYHYTYFQLLQSFRLLSELYSLLSYDQKTPCL